MRRRRTPTIMLALIAVTIIGCSADPQAPPMLAKPPPAPMDPKPGAPGAGDEAYPNDGNGGYDALDYQVGIGFDPATSHLDGDTTVTARATQDLSRFNLDLRGLEVASVQIDDKPAQFAREGDFELVITPAEPIRSGTVYRTRIIYSGKPTQAATAALGDGGWLKSTSGGAYVVGEPHSAAFWYPVNETPLDKATFRLTARVPDGWTVLSNGRDTPPKSAGGWSTTTWTEPNPIASYLTTVAIDKFTVDRATLPDGTPIINAYAPGTESKRDIENKLPEVLDFLKSKFGPYPQSAAGGIFVNEDIHFSLETQTRPTYAKWADLGTIVHENAHQWFGDTVSVRSWSDVCLNECFASYAQWLWQEKSGDDLDARYRAALEITGKSPEFWSHRLTGAPAGHEFEGVYDKGILAMHALRRKLGEDVFNRLLTGWPQQFKHGNASWDDFELFTSNLAGEKLKPFFDTWFHSDKVPADADLYPGKLRG
ncbi:M1 family metallopeptidase [Amycolatopsis sp. cg5]|uniref:M1 family metallopeptidase n=1 Tax=Amycolatopsis sp. cg5 TaxID=3238802 RepID=UPI0035257A05